MTSQPNTIDEAFAKLSGSGAHACYCPRSTDGGCTCALKDEYIAEFKAALLEAIKSAKPGRQQPDFDKGNWGSDPLLKSFNNGLDLYEQNLINLFGGKK